MQELWQGLQAARSERDGQAARAAAAEAQLAAAQAQLARLRGGQPVNGKQCAEVSRATPPRQAASLDPTAQVQALLKWPLPPCQRWTPARRGGDGMPMQAVSRVAQMEREQAARLTPASCCSSLHMAGRVHVSHQRSGALPGWQAVAWPAQL